MGSGTAPLVPSHPLYFPRDADLDHPTSTIEETADGSDLGSTVGSCLGPRIAISRLIISVSLEVSSSATDPAPTVDQIVSLAMAAQLSSWKTRESISSRAKRVDWEKVDQILARVPNLPPAPGDEL
jgi:hypothetical protein